MTTPTQQPNETVFVDNNDSNDTASLSITDEDRITVPSPQILRAADPSLSGGKAEVVFIESNVADYQTLVDGMKAGVEVVLLDSTRNGLSQMAQILEGRSGIDAIHIVSHGSEASLELGSLTLTSQNLQGHAADLETIGSALSQNAGILLYGCDVAAGSDGAAFVSALANATQANIAASTDLTGNASRGGDWVLETTTSQMDTRLAFSNSATSAYRDVLAASTFDFSSGTSVDGTTTVLTINDGTNTLKITSDNGAGSLDGWRAVNDSFTKSATGSGYTTTFTGKYGIIEGLAAGDSITITADMGNDGTFGDAFKLSSFKLADASLNGGDYTIKPNGSAAGQETASLSSLLGVYSFTPGTQTNFNNLTSLTVVLSSNATTIVLDDFSITDPVIPGPTLDSIVRAGGASATVASSATSVNYTVTFSESVTGVDASDFALTKTGTANGSISAVTGSGTTWTATVNSLSGDGTLRLDLNSTGTGIQNGSSVAIGGGYTSGETYSLDHTAPAVPTVDSIGDDTGSDDTDGFTSDRTLLVNGTAAANVTVTLFKDGVSIGTTTSDGAGNWSYDYTGTSLPDGTYNFTATASDSVGNTSAASSAFTAVIDATAPTALTLGTTTITLSSATAGATLTTISATDAHSFTFAKAAGNGTTDANNNRFTVSGTSLKVGGTALTVGSYNVYLKATDIAGNIGYQAFTINVVDVPTVSSINRVSTQTVAGSTTSVQYTVTFSQSVTGGDSNDFTLTKTGTADGTISAVSGSGTSYTVTVDTLSGDGTLRLDLNSSGTGIQNGSSAAISGGYSTGETYTLDHTAPGTPTTEIDLQSGSDTGPSNSDDITKTANPTVRVSLSGTNAAVGDTLELLLGGASLGTPKTKVLNSTDVTTNGYVDFTITNGDLGSDGSKTLTAKVTDAAGNAGTAGGSLTVTLDTANPVITINNTPSFAYTENATAAALDASATVTEAGTPGSSVLTVHVTGNSEPADVLSLPDAAVSGINISGTDLRSDTTNIGTVTASSVTGDTIWTLNFLSTATATDIQNTIAAVRYNNTSGNPGTSDRTVTFNLTDGAGNSATAATRTIAVTAVNNAPTDIALSANTISTYDANDATVGTLTRTDVDGGGPTYSIVTVTNPSSADVTFDNLFNISGAALRASTPSTTTTGDYTVVVRVDDGNSVLDKTFTITVDNSLEVTTNLDSGDDATIGASYTADLADGGGLSLREALRYATTSGSVIKFATGLSGQTITLGSNATVAAGVTFDVDSIGAPGSLTIAGNTLNLSGSLTVNNGSGDSLTISSIIAGGSGSLAKTGAGTLSLSGSNTYTGSTTVSAGTLSVSGGAAISNFSDVTVNTGAALTLSASETIGSLAGAGTVMLGSNTLSAGGDNTSTTFSGVISGTGALTKAGSGTMTLSGNNTFTGATTVSAGTLTLNRNGGALADAGAVTVASGATLTLSAGETIGSLAGAGSVALGANTLTAGDGTNTEFSGVISGTGALTKVGTGTLTLSGNNTYSGATTVSAGGLTLNKGTGPGALAEANAVTVATGATLTLSASETIGSLAGAGSVALGANTLTAGGDNTSTTFSGAIAGTGALTKQGTGTLTLSGTNTYTGGTAVSAGTLAATGTLNGSGAGTVTVSSGATLAGTGTVNSEVFVDDGATLSPGVAGTNSGVGKLTVNGDLRVNGTLVTDIKGAATAGTDYDQVAVTGGVTLNGGSLTVNLTYTPALNDAYVLIDNDSTDAITGAPGTFDNLAEGGRTGSLQASYKTTVNGTGNDFTLTMSNTSPVINNLGSDSVAWAGAGQAVRLDGATAVTASDAELGALNSGNGDWNGASLTVKRVLSGTADATANDVFSFDTSGAGFTVSGNALQAGGQTFATFTNTGGVLTVSFTSSGTTATTALVQSVLHAVTYRNDTPYGTATIRMGLSDSAETTNADVTVTSNVIYVDHSDAASAPDTDIQGDAADGFTLTEALNKAVSGDTIKIQDGTYYGQFRAATGGVTIESASQDASKVTLAAPDSANWTASAQQSIKSGYVRKAILDVWTTTPGTDAITVRYLTLDGRNQGTSDDGDLYAGLSTYNANATIDHVVINNIARPVLGNGDYEGDSNQFGILAEGSSALGSPVTVTITNSTIGTFQKTGIVAWGPQLNADIQHNTINAVGVHGLSNQNGMQIGSGGTRAGTTATIKYNTINDIDADDPAGTYNATGILLASAGVSEIANNTINAQRTPTWMGSYGIDLISVANPINIHDNTFNNNFIGVIVEVDNTAPAAHTLAANNFLKTWFAVFDNQDVDHQYLPAEVADTAVNPITVTVNSGTVDNGQGYLTYDLFGGNDTFTDTGSAPSLIQAGGGNDTVTAGSGADTLTGGASTDSLTGGGGNDVFTYDATGNGIDTITDFGSGDAIRVITQNFTGGTVTTGTGTTVAGKSVQVATSGGNTTLYIDSENDADAPELQINLTGTYLPGNFVLDGEYIRYRSAVTFSGLAFSADTGTSTTDFVTNSAAQTVTATLSAGLGAGEIVYGSLDGGATWTNITSKVSGTALAWNGVTLTTSNTLKLKVTDSAGNDGVIASQAYVLDTTAPAAVAATVAFSADSGVSSKDFITQIAAQNLSGTYTGTIGAGEILQISLDNGITWTPATTATGGSWTLTGQTLAASNTLKVRVVDTAGNSSAVLSQAYVLNTGAPIFASATVNGNTLTMSYSEASALDATHIPAAGAFTVMRGTTAITVTGVTVNADGKTVTLTLASAVASGDAVTVAYADPSAGDDANAIQNSAGNDAATLTATAVTNNTPAAGGTGSTDSGGTETGGPNTGTNTGTGSSNTGSGGTSTGTGGTNTGTGTTGTSTITTVDGMTVTGTTTTTTTTVTDPTTGTERTVTTQVVTTTVPIVPDTRQEEDNSTTLADIPLAKDNSGQTVLAASLPPGIGLTSEAVTGGNSHLTLRELLIAASEPRTEQNAFVSILGQGIDSYVPGVQDEAQVTVRTVTFQTPAGASGQTAAADAPPIIVTGASGTGEKDPAHPDRQEALVIDVRNLPHGTVLQLNNVEFAIIIGATRVTGGDGQNFAVGDDAVQYMVLGADDDLLHGGGGDDIVGSKGGNDQLYGDDGNDTVVGGLGNDSLYGGNGDDLLQGGQSDAGAWTFRLGSDGLLKSDFSPSDSNLADGTVASLSGPWLTTEGRVTSDARVAFTTQAAAKLETVALLYKAVTGALPDVYEMSHWATLDYSDAQFAQAAYEAYQFKQPAVPGQAQTVEAQVTALIAGVWGAQAATADWVAAGTQFIGTGGRWGEALNYLVHHNNFKGKLLNSQGELPLTPTYQTPELGWSGDTGNDQLFGGAGNDTLVGGRGRNLLDGGAGNDRAVVVENRSDYVFRVNSDGQLQLNHKFRADSDVLVGVESVVFGDQVLSTGASNLDSATLKALVGLYRLETGAAPSLAELNAQASHPVQLGSVAAQLMQTSGYQSHWAGLNDSQFLAQLRTTVVGAPLAGAEQAYWLGQLANGLSRDQAFIEAVGVASYQQALFGGEGVLIGA